METIKNIRTTILSSAGYDNKEMQSKLYAEGDKMALLTAIRNKYNTNTCYSEFTDFLYKNDINSEGFSWR